MKDCRYCADNGICVKGGCSAFADDCPCGEHLDICKYYEEENKMWKPENNKGYLTFENDKTLVEYIWHDDEVDHAKYSIGNCFKTEEEAKFAFEKLKVITELKRFAEENNENEMDWKDDVIPKYYILYNYTMHKLNIDFRFCFKGNDVYFSSREIAKQAIETIGEDRLKKYYFKIEE